MVVFRGHPGFGLRRMRSAVGLKIGQYIESLYAEQVPPRRADRGLRLWAQTTSSLSFKESSLSFKKSYQTLKL